MSVFYRRDGESEWKTVAAAKRALPAPPGTTHWRAEIPPHANGLVEYYVEATDGNGHVGRYPLDAPESAPLYLVGLEPRKLPTYTKNTWEVIPGGSIPVSGTLEGLGEEYDIDDDSTAFDFVGELTCGVAAG